MKRPITLGVGERLEVRLPSGASLMINGGVRQHGGGEADLVNIFPQQAEVEFERMGTTSFVRITKDPFFRGVITEKKL